jgi:hypothetical protein
MRDRHYNQVRSNWVAVNDLDAVRKVIAGYSTALRIHLSLPCAPDASNAAELRIMGKFGYPHALPLSAIPPKDAFKNEAGWWDAKFELELERGEAEFGNLLLALAPYLAGTLIVQAYQFTALGRFDEATEWAAKPGAAALEIKKISRV